MESIKNIAVDILTGAKSNSNTLSDHVKHVICYRLHTWRTLRRNCIHHRRNSILFILHGQHPSHTISQQHLDFQNSATQSRPE